MHKMLHRFRSNQQLWGLENFILITGASTGIGEHAAGLLIRHGYSILAGVRSETDANRLKEKYGARLFPLLLDVTNDDQVRKAFSISESIIGENALVAIINNAGFAVSGAVLYIPIEEWRKQFEVNLFGVVRITQVFFPLLKRNIQSHLHPRRVINISSVSGLFAAPFLAPYVASKFALEGMSDSLRRELYMYDIQVVIIEPGNIRTPMWSKARSGTSYMGPEYDNILAFKDKIIDNNIKASLAPELLNPILEKAVFGKKVRPRYLIRPQKWKFNLIRLLPVSMVDRMFRKRLQSRSGFRP